MTFHDKLTIAVFTALAFAISVSFQFVDGAYL